MMVGDSIGEARSEATATRRLTVTLPGQHFDVVPMTLAIKLKEIGDIDTLTFSSTAILEVGSVEGLDAMLDKAVVDCQTDR